MSVTIFLQYLKSLLTSLGQQLRRLLQKVRRPSQSQLLIVAFATVLSLVLMLATNLQLKRFVRLKMKRQLAELETKIGVPVKIKSWSLGFGYLLCEGIVIGDHATAVASRVRLDISLNPFADNFGALSTITVDRVRFKLRLPSQAILPSADPQRLTQWPPQVAAQVLEKVFQALPSERLFIRSATAQILNANQAPLMNVSGLTLLLERADRRVEFKINELAATFAAVALEEKNLAGKLQLFRPTKESETTRLSFLLKRKKPAGNHSDWVVAGDAVPAIERLEMKFRIRQWPNWLPADLQNKLTGGDQGSLGLSGDLVVQTGSSTPMASNPGTPAKWWQLVSHVKSTGLILNLPLLSQAAIGPIKATARLVATYQPERGLFNIQEATIDWLPQPAEALVTTVIANGQMRRDAATESYAIGLQGKVVLAETSCQTLLNSAPNGLLPALKGFELNGSLRAGIEFRIDSRRPENATFHAFDTSFGCKVIGAPAAYSAAHLAGPLALRRGVEKNSQVLTIKLAQNSPDFTALPRIAPQVSLAFTTAEDVGFWSHSGIDIAALENAIRRNFSEKRVAVGGSTITMQTAKNLFLSPERTIARKLQELFLAWHLESELPKSRIFELYVNIAEFGPSIYGITHAARHFFGKRPAELDLLESAYLASLLPSPKMRYRYFCNGRLTPNFRGMVGGLLRRMRALGRISGEQYGTAINGSLHFNEQARLATRSCAKHANEPDLDPGPS